MENFKAKSERPKGSGRSLSPPPGTNRYPTPSGASSTTRPVYDHMQFSNCTIRTSGEAAVAGYRPGKSLVSIPRNMPFEKADEDGREDLGG